jgi:hypothetical protein
MPHGGKLLLLAIAAASCAQAPPPRDPAARAGAAATASTAQARAKAPRTIGGEHVVEGSAEAQVLATIDLDGAGGSAPAPAAAGARAQPPEARDPAATPGAVEAASPPAEIFSHAWSAQTAPFPSAIALGPGGEVAVAAGRRLTLLSAAGARLAERDACAALAGAIAFEAEHALLVACADALRRYGGPSLEPRDALAWPGRARATAAALGSDALVLTAGLSARLVATRTAEPRSELRLGGAATALALSVDAARLAVGLAGGDVLVFDGPLGSAPQRLPAGRGNDVAALAFSPDGERLLVGAGPVTAVWAPAGARVVHRFDLVSGVSSARWLDAGAVAVVGADGVLVLDVARGSASSVGGGAGGPTAEPVALAVSRDARRLCVADRDGRVSCHARGRGAAPLSPPALGAEMVAAVGRVVRHRGPELTLSAPGGALPDTGARVRVSRYEEPAGAWHFVGSARVVTLRGAAVELRFEPTDGVATAAGTPPSLVRRAGGIDALAAGTPIQLAWPRR